MAPSRPDKESPAPSPGPGQAVSGRHALREQDVLWADFLALAASVVNSLEKSVQAICDGRFDLISEVENEEEDSNRREVLIEQECLRILALYEPVASDLRRMATVLKVNRDWERIADLALRVARRARKLRATPAAWPCPRRSSNWLAMCSHRYVQVTGPWPAETVAAARAVIAGDNAIDAQYRALRKQFKAGLGQYPEQLDAWLELMNTARNLERIADHAAGIAQTVVYLEEGVIIRHTPSRRSAD